MEERTPPPISIKLEPVFHPYPEDTLRTIDPVKIKGSGRRCLAITEKPADFEDANTKECWRHAMKEELGSIHDNNACELVDLPNNEKTMELKWEFTIKKEAEGNCVKHKAKLLFKEYMQDEGVGFKEVFVHIA